MMFSAPGDVFIEANAPENAKHEINSLGDVGWTSLGNQVRLVFPSTISEKDIYYQRDKAIGTNSGTKMEVKPLIAKRDRFSGSKTVIPIEKFSGLSKSLSEYIVNAVEIARSKYCVSSEDGQKLYKTIRSALLDGKKVFISFESNVSVSSAFLDEAIGNLYNGEFDENDLKRRLNYIGLSQDDLQLLGNIIEWTKQDLSQPVSMAEAYYD